MKSGQRKKARKKEPDCVEIIDVCDDDSIHEVEICSQSLHGSNGIKSFHVSDNVATPYGIGRILQAPCSLPAPPPPAVLGRGQRTRNLLSNIQYRIDVEAIEVCTVFKVQLAFGVAFLMESSLKHLSPRDNPVLLEVKSRHSNSLITINKMDLLRLRDGEPLDDSLVNIGLHYFVPSSSSQAVQVASSFLYPSIRSLRTNKKLTRAQIFVKLNKVLSHTSMSPQSLPDYLLIPFHFKHHWSIAVLSRPDLLIEEKLKPFRDSISSSSSSSVVDGVIELPVSKHIPSGSRLLLLDSASAHAAINVFPTLRWFLTQICYSLHDSLVSGSGESDGSCLIDALSVTGPDIPGCSVLVPHQGNTYDCGLWVIAMCRQFQIDVSCLANEVMHVVQEEEEEVTDMLDYNASEVRNDDVGEVDKMELDDDDDFVVKSRPSRKRKKPNRYNNSDEDESDYKPSNSELETTETESESEGDKRVGTRLNWRSVWKNVSAKGLRQELLKRILEDVSSSELHACAMELFNNASFIRNN